MHSHVIPLFLDHYEGGQTPPNIFIKSQLNNIFGAGHHKETDYTISLTMRIPVNFFTSLYKVSVEISQLPLQER